MKFNSVINSNHELKKNGYKIIRKLHKMEKTDGANRAYAAAYEDTYYFILGCRALADIIKIEYPDARDFKSKCDEFIIYLEGLAVAHRKINKSVLAGFLRSYTKFFNNIIEQKIPFVFGQDLIERWNIGCLMPYIATWGSNH